MKGYPKHLSTKTDYIFARDNFPKEMWAKDWQALLDSRWNWFFVKEQPTKDGLIEDATHKIVENKDMGGVDNVTYSQYELRDDENADLFRLGFTVAEVEAALAG